MERARWKAPAASRVDLVGASVGSPVGRTRGSEVEARVGDVLHIDGEEHTVRQILRGQVMCSVGAEDTADDWEVLTKEEAAGMLRMERGGENHAPSPDVRLVRDMWVRRGGKARVHAVKFM